MTYPNAQRRIDAHLGEMAVQPKEKLDDFMDDFWKKTHPHPFDRHQRVLGYRDDDGTEAYIVFELRPWEGRIHISSFSVMPPEARKRGFGKVGMKWLMDLARKHRVDLEGFPKPYGAEPRMTKPQLIKFYKSMGYKMKGGDILFDPEITEGKQVGVVYHFTTNDYIMSILKQKRMIPHQFEAAKQFTGHTGKKYYFGVSATRSKHSPFKLDLKNPVPKFGFRLALDGNRLSNRYKIIPVAELGFRTADHGKEHEELIVVRVSDEPRNPGVVLDLKPGDLISVAVSDLFDEMADFYIANEDRRTLSGIVDTLSMIQDAARGLGAEFNFYKGKSGQPSPVSVDSVLEKIKAYLEAE